MTRTSSVRAGLYLLLSLAVFILTSTIPSPVFAALVRLAAVLALCIAELFLSASHALPFPLRPKKEALPTLLLFPVFLFITLAVNLLSATIIRFCGGTLPTVARTPATFVSAVLLAPLTEEILFRGLTLRLFRPYGEKRAICLSAIAFSLAHASLFQIPYAFAAGILLAVTALLGETLLLPILFHVAYNLLTYFGNAIPASLLLRIAGGIATVTFSVFLSHRPAYTPKEEAKLAVRELIPFFAYALLLIFLTVSAML